MKRALEKLSRNIKMTVARGIVRAIEDSGELQKLQVSILADETADDVERLQNYGFASHPLPESTAALVFIGGYRDQGMAIAVDDSRHRPDDLKPGEVKIYTNQGDEIHLKDDKTIRVYSSKTVEIESDDKVTVKASNCEIDADVKIKGELEVEKAVTLKDKLEVDKDITTKEDVKADGDCISDAQIKQVSGKAHGHVTLVGNTVPPVIPTQGA